MKKTLETAMQNDLVQFANFIETSRSMWRKHREFVESPKFPKQFRKVLLDRFGIEPDDYVDVGSDVLAADFREKQLKFAQEVVAEQLAKEATEKTGDSTLPDWLTETPGTAYTLEAGSRLGGAIEQMIEVSFEEFEAMKIHLAKMRGLPIPDDTEQEGGSR